MWGEYDKAVCCLAEFQKGYVCAAKQSTFMGLNSLSLWYCTRSGRRIFMPPPLGAGGIMFSVCPSVRLKPEIPSFDLYMGPLVHPTNRNRFTACPSVLPSVRPSWEVSGHLPENAWRDWPEILHADVSWPSSNCLVYDRGLLIFLILALFWLSEMGQIWGFRAFPGERIEGMVWNFARWCIFTTFRTD